MMKNLLLLLLVFIGITSCSKDSLDQNPDSFVKPNKSEIMVSVTSLQWTSQGETSCGGNGGETLTYILNAKVELYAGEQDGSDGLGVPLLNIKTNAKGAALMEDIEPASYTVLVDTPFGKKSRIVTTQLHKRSYIDFSF